jgi:hypothetical protein
MGSLAARWTEWRFGEPAQIAHNAQREARSGRSAVKDIEVQEVDPGRQHIEQSSPSAWLALNNAAPSRVMVVSSRPPLTIF